ncbi:NAD-dependent epimerase/dehydratase family protein [Bdellovibrio bacteriovorus]|uniref:UDP-N-acetyl-D-quinovosamine 4-epimerase n=1 Tax=Bdellovibrio bacteriovorus (strain ATCC 15356 / DSM 50701 / NCIMB 9529 / HD100) TaxID=264462 RepID=Q6MMD8_BDEBA|nr:NAD-dependent epimerase/dehydratase family protein [Bdellovibrio bacteriovorus]CAE79567.1 UDP-N-acetyl-D-quinovosamine 4-epimerase [Bdellovibrio bacteriovorus HD100]
MIKVLLTGASGFVGSNFLQRHGKEFAITTVSLKSSSPEALNLSSYDCILHCAALVHQMQGAPEEQYFTINYELTKKLADTAKRAGVHHFIYISTAHVFGDSGDLYQHDKRLNEKSPCHPHDPYGKSKLAAEEYLQSISSEAFTVSIVRPPMVYGRGAKGNILSLIKLVKKAPFIPLGYRENARSIVSVGNLCHYLSLVIKKRAAGVFLPQDREPISIGALVESIALALGVKRIIFTPPQILLKILFLLTPKISLRLFGTLAMNSAEGDKIIGYNAPLSTQEGLAEMIQN